MGHRADWWGVGPGQEEARGWLGAWTSVCPDKPLATVLALVNFKSRFNRRQKKQNAKNPKATTNNKTKKEKLNHRLGTGCCVPLHCWDSLQLSSTQTEGRTLHIFSFVSWLEDRRVGGAQGMSTKATPVLHLGVRRAGPGLWAGITNHDQL